MKKKTIISSVVAAAMLASTCACFAGCKLPERPPKDDGKIHDASSIDENTNPDDIASDAVTAEQFTAAFAKAAFANATMNSTMQVGAAGVTQYTNKTELKNDGDKVSEKESTETISGHGDGSSLEYAQKKSDNKFYSYDVGPDGMLIETQIETNEDGEALTDADFRNAYGIEGKMANYVSHIAYTDLSFDDSKKEYKGTFTVPMDTDEEESTPDVNVQHSIEAKFLQEKIVWAKITCSYEKNAATVNNVMDALFHHYGNTSVSIDDEKILPTYASATGEQVADEDAWKAAWAEAANVTSVNMNSATWAMQDGDKALSGDAGSNTVSVKVDGNWYKFAKANGITYKKSAGSGFDGYMGGYNYIAETQINSFASYEYDDDEKAYVSKDNDKITGIVKIVGGKVTWAYAAGYMYHFYNYGATAVTSIPTPTASEDWADYAVENFKMTHNGNESFFNGANTLVKGYDGDTYYTTSAEGLAENYIRSYVKEGNTAYYSDQEIDLSNSEFIATTYHMNAEDYTKNADGVYVSQSGAMVYFKNGYPWAKITPSNYADDIVVFSDWGAVEAITLPADATAADAWGSVDFSNCTVMFNGEKTMYMGNYVRHDIAAVRGDQWVFIECIGHNMMNGDDHDDDYSEEEGKTGYFGNEIITPAKTIIVDWSAYTGNYDATEDASNSFGTITMWVNGAKTEINATGDDYTKAMKYMPFSKKCAGLVECKFTKNAGVYEGNADDTFEGWAITFNTGKVYMIMMPDPEDDENTFVFGISSYGTTEFDLPQA